MPKLSAKTNNAIVVDHLSVALAGNVILDDISFAIRKGSMTAIIGPNGCGKTTLLRAMLGLIHATGTVQVHGAAPGAGVRVVGYVPQRFDFDRTFPITVDEFLNLAREKTTRETQITSALKEVGLTNAVREKRVGALSGGQLQRVLIAQAILNSPPVLMLDEPATGIDAAGEAAVMHVLTHLQKEHGTTIVIVSHDLGMIAESVDDVICINHRLVCSGPPERMLTSSRLATLYGGHAKPLHHGHHPTPYVDTP